MAAALAGCGICYSVLVGAPAMLDASLLRAASSWAWVMLSTASTLSRDFWPEAIFTWERRNPSASATNSTHAWFAAPSTGGAVSLTQSTPSRTPTTWFVEARGCTLTRTVAVFGEPPLANATSLPAHGSNPVKPKQAILQHGGGHACGYSQVQTKLPFALHQAGGSLNRSHLHAHAAQC